MDAFQLILEKLITQEKTQVDLLRAAMVNEGEDLTTAIDIVQRMGRIEGLAAAAGLYREEGCPRERAHDGRAFKIAKKGGAADA